MTAFKSNRIKPSHTNFMSNLIFLTIIFAIATISAFLFNKSSILINNSEGFNTMDNNLVSVNPFDFMRYNISHPDCCKYSGGYSNGTGCICITPTQEKILDSRGSYY